MELAPTLEGIVNSNLKWIFVGGKGGVGKTTTAASLATLLARHKDSVLIISTDPAHNLSDAFDQKIGAAPTQVQGVNNLYAMEVKPSVSVDDVQVPNFLGLQNDEATKSILQEIATSVPGVDEAMGFATILKSIEGMNFSVIVFDTAPTGHTMRLLNLPSILNKGLDKLMTLKQSLGTMLSQISAIATGRDSGADHVAQAFEKLESMKRMAEYVDSQFQNPEITTFVAVCIPEFLSIYETERLVQELFRFHIEIGHVVVNQVLFPEDTCRMCVARKRMQQKYLDQIYDIYADFHVVVTPLLEEEVRGVQNIAAFAQHLLVPYRPPSS